MNDLKNLTPEQLLRELERVRNAQISLPDPPDQETLSTYEAQLQAALEARLRPSESHAAPAAA